MGLPWQLSGKKKNLLAMQEPQETWVRSLGWEDPLEKGTTHSSVLAWRIRRTEEPGRLQSMGLQRVGHDRATNTLMHFSAPWDRAWGEASKLE